MKYGLKCGFCDYNACKTCVKRYLLSSSDDANCMNCKRVWSTDVLNDMFGKSFMMTDWKVHRENVLYERDLLHPTLNHQLFMAMFHSLSVASPH